MNEEIKKLIEEEASNRYLEYLHGTSNGKEFLSMTDLMPLHDAIKSCEITVNFILSKWQEAERWRKVEEELPEVKEFGVSDYVLTKCDYESYQVAQYCKNKYYPDGSWFNPDRELSITPVEWKPIS